MVHLVEGLVDAVEHPHLQGTLQLVLDRVGLPGVQRNEVLDEGRQDQPVLAPTEPQVRQHLTDERHIEPAVAVRGDAHHVLTLRVELDVDPGRVDAHVRKSAKPANNRSTSDRSEYGAKPTRSPPASPRPRNRDASIA